MRNLLRTNTGPKAVLVLAILPVDRGIYTKIEVEFVWTPTSDIKKYPRFICFAIFKNAFASDLH